MKPSSEPDMVAVSDLTPRFPFPLIVFRLATKLIKKVKAYLVDDLRGDGVTGVASLERVHLFSKVLEAGSGVASGSESTLIMI
jgi:hypothetical protein